MNMGFNTGKMLYFVQDEQQIPYMYNNVDCAFCIGGREIRVNTPMGMQIYKLQEQKPAQSAAAPSNDIMNILKQQGDAIAALQQTLSKLTSKEASSNENTKGNGSRNVF